MSIYKHGSYGEQVPFAGELPITSDGTTPCYVGTAPIHLMNVNGDPAFDYSPYINKPILIQGYSEAETYIGYSDDWAKFTLCEAVSAHFLNGMKVVAPIILVNVLDPKTHKATEATTKTVTLIADADGKVGYIEDKGALLETLQITGDTLTEGDYTASYDSKGIKLLVTKAGFQGASVEVSYNALDTTDTKITADVFKQGVEALELCNNLLNIRPNILVAPGYSHKPEYHKIMIQKANAKITEKWNFICCSDIPATSSVNTVDLAKEWKEDNFYNSKLDKLCWPMTTFEGSKYHLSTLAVVNMQYEDTNYDGVPYMSPSNKVIPADGLILEDGTAIYLNEIQANKLNEKGITTGNIIRGQLRLWGPHMANYDFTYEEDINPEDMFDCSIRMGLYLLNTLQYEWIDEIDTSFTKRDIDALIASIQKWLNTLVNEGKLLFAEVTFNETSNPVNEIIAGNFVFDIKHTVAPNAKSITYKVQYVLDGINSLFGGEA